MSAAEVWHPVPGFEESYEVSDLGRVRSLDRDVPVRASATSANGYVRRRRGVILRPDPNRDSDHLTVRLYRDGTVERWGVHRLVLTAFVGECPPGLQGCHLDDDPLNNRLGNLRWDTPAKNQAQSHRSGRAFFARARVLPVHVVAAELADELRAEGQVDLADVFSRFAKLLKPRKR